MVSSLYTCPASVLAKSLLDVWLSGDHRRLRVELENVERMAVPVSSDDEWDRVELLKSIAGRMRESSDLFATRAESPRIGTWFDLLRHLSVDGSLVH